MNYQIECNVCGATCWVRGTPDEASATVALEDPDVEDFCDHSAYDIIDQEESFEEGE